MLDLSQDILTELPVFIDLETRSACDLRKVGGWNYAQHPSTHLLTVAWSPEPGEYHVWYPWHTIREDYSKAQGTTATLHFGNECPEALSGLTYRRWCAHNAWNFDALVWRAVMGDAYEPKDWIDTEPLARTVALPGGLDAIGKRLWGEGKYKAAKQALKKHMVGVEYGDAADVPAGIMPLLAEYNVQDVVLLADCVWPEIVRWCKMPPDEWATLAAHRAINDRGAPVDTDLLNALIDLTDEGKVFAVKQIAALTEAQGKTALKTINDLQSRAKVLAWLDSIGIKLSTKPSLRKELIAQFVDVHTNKAENDSDDGADEPEDTGPGGDDTSDNTMLAVRVLQLRGSAIRITGGKLASASAAVCADGRLRGLFVYAGAHTWRWAGRRFQPQNLPRPKDGVSTWAYLELFARTSALRYDDVDALLPDRKDPRYRYLTPDDVASALSRSIVTAHKGKFDEEADPVGFAFADFANIEARVLAWLAGELWLMEAFVQGKDPYIPMAEVIFGPSSQWSVCDGGVKKHPRRQVGKIVELGAGFQLGGTKMDVYAAANGIDLRAAGTSGPECIMAYRKKHPAIAGHEAGEYQGAPYFRDGIWQKLNEAAIAACTNRGQTFAVGAKFKVRFVCEGPHLMCYLPSGRRLIYRDASVQMVQPKYLVGTNKQIEAVVYHAPRFGRTEMYGGKWCENVVQAIARDALANSIVNLERDNMPVVIHVHDEPGSEGVRLSERSRFMRLVTTKAGWMGDFPLDAEGGWMSRYSKSPPPGARYKEEVWRDGQYLKAA